LLYFPSLDRLVDSLYFRRSGEHNEVHPMSASSHFQYLLGGSQQTKVASDRLDLLAKTAARRYLHESVPLNESIKKIASENDLNPNQIERVCEIANLATHQGLWAKTAQKESVAFDLADAKTIIRVSGNGTNGAPCDVAPPPSPCGGDSDYMGPPKGIPSPGPSLSSLLGSDPSSVHHGMGMEPERKRIIVVIQKHAAARKILQDQLVFKGMELESLEKRAYNTIKQCVLGGESFQRIYQAAAGAGLGKMAEEYLPLFEDRLIEEVHGADHRRLVKEAIGRAPEDLISSDMGNTTIINGAHPVMISLDTIQRKTGEIKNGLHNLLRIDDEIKVFTQRMRELS
jgi:hypothetical protein